MSYLFDTHVHTRQASPCGKVDAQTVARAYMDSDYAGVCIADHFTRLVFDRYPETDWVDKVSHFLSGYRTVRDTAKDSDLTVLLGMEIRFSDHPNDYLVYGITEDLLYDNPWMFDMTLPRFYEFVKENDLILYQAHPFRDNITPMSPEFLDGIEVYNGHPRHNSRNHKALAYAYKYGLKHLSGSDAHQTEDFCRGGVYLPERPKDSIALKELLRADRLEGLKRTE